MKAYLIATGIIFALITGAHILRMVYEGPALVKEPSFILLTVLTASLSGWAWWLVLKLPRA